MLLSGSLHQQGIDYVYDNHATGQYFLDEESEWQCLYLLWVGPSSQVVISKADFLCRATRLALWVKYWFFDGTHPRLEAGFLSGRVCCALVWNLLKERDIYFRSRILLNREFSQFVRCSLRVRRTSNFDSQARFPNLQSVWLKHQEVVTLQLLEACLVFLLVTFMHSQMKYQAPFWVRNLPNFELNHCRYIENLL